MKEFEDALFEIGTKIENDHFQGDTYLSMLSGGECPIANVTFAPGSRNSWHLHQGGQILLITSGQGYYQEWGKEAQRIQTGDVIEIPAHVKHWHGARKDTALVHIALEVHPELGPATWLEPVDDELYMQLP